MAIFLCFARPRIMAGGFFCLVFCLVFSGPLFLTAQVGPGQQSQALEDGLQRIAQKIEFNKLEDALQEAEPLQLNFPESLELREILFELYLQKKLFAKAKRQLTFLESRQSLAKSMYLEAWLLLETGDFSASKNLALQLVQQERAKQTPLEQAEILLLLGNIELGLNFLESAERYARLLQAGSGETLEWYSLLAKILKKKYELAKTSLAGTALLGASRERLEKHLDFFREAFYQQARPYALKANLEAEQNNIDSALLYINKALSLDGANLEYQREKLSLLYRLGRRGAAIELLTRLQESALTGVSQRAFDTYLLAFLRFTEIRQEATRFKVKVSDSASEKFNEIILLLERSLSLQADGRVQFFMEQLLLRNAASLNLQQALLKAASLRHEKALQAFSQGLLEQARLLFLRALTLAPQSSEIRRSYAAYFQEKKLLDAYKEELEIIQLLEGEEKAASDYVTQTRIQLIEKEQRNSLLGRYGLSQANLRASANSLLLLYPEKNVYLEYSFPYQSVILAAMAESLLRSSFVFEVEAASESLAERMLAQKSYQAVLFFEEVASVQDDVFALRYRLLDASTRLPLETKTTSLPLEAEESSAEESSAGESSAGGAVFIQALGRDRFFKVFEQLLVLLEKAIPKRGELIHIEGNRIVFSLGRRTLAGDETEFLLEKNGFSETSERFTILKIEERVSEGRIANFSVLRQLRLGDVIRVLAKE